MYAVKRYMRDEDGDEMEGYLTEYGEYGTKDEAYAFEDYDEAAKERDNDARFFHQEFPFDDNDFDVVELD